jgi:hypothetical protein
MRQKFSIQKNDEQLDWHIKEYGEVEKGSFFLLSEVTYPHSDIETAVAAGIDRLIDILRSKHLFPPHPYAEQLAQGVESLFHSDQPEIKEIIVDDMLLIAAAQLEEEEEPVEDHPEAIAEILDEEDVAEPLENKIAAKDVDPPAIKAADTNSAEAKDGA